MGAPPTPDFGAKTSKKLQENERNWTAGVGASARDAHGSANEKVHNLGFPFIKVNANLTI